MKKAMILMLVTLAIVAGSCSKKDQTNTAAQATTTTTSLPTKASNYVATNYPDATIDYILVLTNSSAKYIVTLNTTEELAFNSDGDYLGNGGPFLLGHHPGDTIFCDSNGCGGGGHGGHGHHGPPPPPHGKGHWIPLDSLSSTIKNFISGNYPGYTILHAEYDSLCPDGLVKDVMIGERDTVPPLKLVFSSTDTYLLKANRIRYGDVPQAVKAYITANYPGWEACCGSEKYILADNSEQYMIYLQKNRAHMRVRLQADGTFICSQ
jgi:hypothetical protein